MGCRALCWRVDRSVTQRRGRWHTCGRSVGRGRCAISTRTQRCNPRGMPSSTSAGASSPTARALHVPAFVLYAHVCVCTASTYMHMRMHMHMHTHTHMHIPCVPIHATQPPVCRRVRGDGARRARAHRRAAADRHAQLLEAARAGLAAVAPLTGAAHQPHVGHGGGLQEGSAGADARAALRRGPVPADARILPLARAGAAA